MLYENADELATAHCARDVKMVFFNAVFQIRDHAPIAIHMIAFGLDLVGGRDGFETNGTFRIVRRDFPFGEGGAHLFGRTIQDK